MTFNRLLPLFAALTFVPAFAEEHDHSHHSGAACCDPPAVTAPSTAPSWFEQLGLALEMVEDRVIGNQEVTALPQSSIIKEGNKTFVLARDEENPDQFQRWEVTLGQSDNEYVAAITGVFPGDYVLKRNTPVGRTAPQYSEYQYPQSPSATGCAGCDECAGVSQTNPNQPRYGSQPDTEYYASPYPGHATQGTFTAPCEHGEICPFEAGNAYQYESQPSYQSYEDAPLNIYLPSQEYHYRNYQH